MSERSGAGRLALVLHSHMPYVEGFGTWPAGEEWLWEAIATSYLPLLELLDRWARTGAGGAPLTLSLTPVLCDQLAAPGAGERFLEFVRGVRAETHSRDIAGCRAGGEPELARELERSLADYERAARDFEALPAGGLLAALLRHASWTSAATHAVLPLLATDDGARLQLRTGIDSHRRRIGERAWGGGLWLPECAYAPWLAPLLAAEGVRAVCLDLTDVLGRGAPAQLRPLAAADGVTLVPIDRETIELVWSPGGYPAHAAYRDSHRRTIHHHNPWANDGRAYDRERARATARADARDFVGRVRGRIARAAQPSGQPPLVVCAIDTELLGHWWFEGVTWLDAVLGECVAQGLEPVRLDDALAALDPAPAPALAAPTTWGEPRDLTTWSGPRAAPFAWRARELELRMFAGAARAAPAPRALRELLALQSSDWAFMVSRELAGPYPRQRAAGHARSLRRALAGDRLDPALRNLAPFLAA